MRARNFALFLAVQAALLFLIFQQYAVLRLRQLTLANSSLLKQLQQCEKSPGGNTDCSSYKTQIKQASIKLAQNKILIQGLQKNNTNCNNQKSLIKGHIASITNQNNDLEKQLAICKANKKQPITQDCSNYRIEITELGSLLIAKNKQIQTLEQNEQQCVGQIRKLESQIKQTVQANHNLQQKLSECKHDLGKKDPSCKQLATYQAKIQNLQSTILQLKGKIISSDRNDYNNLKTIATLQSQLKTCNDNSLDKCKHLNTNFTEQAEILLSKNKEYSQGLSENVQILLNSLNQKIIELKNIKSCNSNNNTTQTVVQLNKKQIEPLQDTQQVESNFQHSDFKSE